MEAIQKAQLLKDELDGLRPISKENELRIMQKFRLDWNYHSNNLEGNSLTYGETKALILFGLTAQGKSFKDHLEMTGHNEAVEWVEELVKQDRPLTQAFIRDLHTLLLKEPYQVDAITPTGEPTKKWIIVGDYKQTPNHVRTKTGEIFRFATVEETPSKMTDLVDWFQAEKEKDDYNAIITAIEFHYRFICIHPFDDGNGRTARILMNFILMQSGYPPVVIKTGEKQQYIAALEQADTGIFEPFINFITENLCASLELMIKGAKGEPVEEEDDVDKEIALLDNRLRNFSTSEQKTTPETITNFSENVLRKYLEVFTESIDVFQKYFLHRIIDLSSSVSGIERRNYTSKDEFINQILLLQKENSLIRRITIQQFFKDSEIGELSDSSIEFTMTVYFFDKVVEIDSHHYKNTLLYANEVSKAELNVFSKQLKRKGLSEIKAILN